MIASVVRIDQIERRVRVAVVTQQINLSGGPAPRRGGGGFNLSSCASV